MSRFKQASTKHVEPLKNVVPPSNSLHWFKPVKIKTKEWLIFLNWHISNIMVDLISITQKLPNGSSGEERVEGVEEVGLSSVV